MVQKKEFIVWQSLQYVPNSVLPPVKEDCLQLVRIGSQHAIHTG
ncbi:hypothetical protein ENHYDAX1_360010 [Enhydrobacter sp. AX1]|nr:hypothetical protein ENHYDAX1_360010 [Enhydrobacter sp. AX1]